MAQPQFKPRPTTMLSDFRYPLPRTDNPMPGSKFPATMNWATSESGKIFFKVNDGIYGKDDPNHKYKEVEMSWADRNVIFNLIEEACKDQNFKKSAYSVKKFMFGAGGQMNSQPSTQAVFTIYRDQQGRICLGYTRSTYKVSFPFSHPFESTLTQQGDEDQSQAVALLSCMYARACVDFFRTFLDKWETDHYTPREKNDNGGNGGWKNNNNNNGGGNNNNRAAPEPDFDDSLDF